MDNFLEIDKLTELYGGDGTVEILTLFLKEAGELITQCAECIANHDHQSLARSAHQLRGAAAFATSTRFESICQDLEKAARSNDWAEAERLQAELGLLFAIAVPSIKSYLSSITNS